MDQQAKPRFLGLEANVWIYIGVALLLSGDALSFVYRHEHPELTYGQWQETSLYVLSNVITFAGFIPFGVGVVLRWRRVFALPDEQRRRVYKRVAILVPVLFIIGLLPLLWFVASKPH